MCESPRTPARRIARGERHAIACVSGRWARELQNYAEGSRLSVPWELPFLGSGILTSRTHVRARARAILANCNASTLPGRSTALWRGIEENVTCKSLDMMLHTIKPLFVTLKDNETCIVYSVENRNNVQDFKTDFRRLEFGETRILKNSQFSSLRRHCVKANYYVSQKFSRCLIIIICIYNASSSFLTLARLTTARGHVMLASYCIMYYVSTHANRIWSTLTRCTVNCACNVRNWF